MEKVSPCRCGSAPYFKPYEQPVGGTAYQGADGYVFDERGFR